jgi:hypothetical protein
MRSLPGIGKEVRDHERGQGRPIRSVRPATASLDAAPQEAAATRQ